MNIKNFLIILFVVLISCNTEKSDNKFVGTWKINEFVVIRMNQRNWIRDAEKLKNEGAIWDLQLKSDGTFVQEFNMDNPTKTLRTESGSWRVSQDTMYVTFGDKADKNPPQVYTYAFKEEKLVLTMTGPQRMGRIISTFSKE